MKKPMHTTILITTAMTTALIGGLFYAYSCSVNPGLGRLPDAQYIAAMQAINEAIINPLFMMSFMGTLLLLPLSTYCHYSATPTARFYLLLLATVTYAVGVFGVTMFGNVPLNDALARINLNASADELKAQRTLFEGPWNSLHRIRSLASALTILFVVMACIFDNGSIQRPGA
ncbi:anthrone oxygenase family protein [Chryseosolibacter histidini]|nr:anthrone oxygenase family protein [Chryseosolibacter histidini]